MKIPLKLLSAVSLGSLLLTGFGCAPQAPATTVSSTVPAGMNIAISSTSPEDPDLHALMLGVISGPDAIGDKNGAGGPNLTKSYQDYGVTSVRNNDYYDDRLDLTGIFNCGGSIYPSWEGCDANDDKNYHWELSDQQYQSYIDGGFVPFLRVGTAFQNPSNPHAYISPQNETQRKNLIIAAEKMVSRYENWPAKPHAFTYLDLWTEFPGHLWDAKTNEFYPFWADLYSALKSRHPELKIGGPGLLGDPAEEEKKSGSSVPVKFLTELYNRKLKLDWLGWHKFDATPESYALWVKKYDDLLAGTGEFAGVPWAMDHFFANTEVFVDAYDLDERDPDNMGDKTIYSREHRAALMTAVWIALQSGDIEGAYYYRGNDQGDRPEGVSNALFMYSGDPIVNSYAFRLFSLMTKNYPTLISTSIPADDSTKDIWAMAAKNATGGTALLVTNTTNKAKTFSITLPNGQSALEAVGTTVRLVDDANHGDAPLPLTTDSITLPPYGVELVEFKP